MRRHARQSWLMLLIVTAALTFTNLQDLSAEEAPLKDHEVELASKLPLYKQQ